MAHAAQINPEAGNHPIPDDKREVDAALKAGKEIWNMYPYFEQRFGDRGKRFTDSDICWLATLPNLEQKLMLEQVEWLGSVLSTRGMPQILLEDSLHRLHYELCKAVPENEAQYNKLLSAVKEFREKRFGIIPENEYDKFITGFESSVGNELCTANKNSGAIILSAIADEHNGISGALDTVTAFMLDESRFPEEWIRAVNELITKTAKFITPEGSNL